MKRTTLILIVLISASLACTTLTGGNKDNNNNGGNLTRSNTDSNTPPAENEAPGEDFVIDSDLSTDSACYNAFYPVNQERVWVYQTSMVGEDPTEFTIATTDVTEDSLTSTMTFPEFSSTVRWICGEDGLFSSEFAQFNFAMMPGVDIETLSYDGVTLPDEDLWEIGYTWDSSYEINIDMNFQGIALDTVVDATFSSEISSIEEVSVSAGTYPEAYRVDMTGTIKFNMMSASIDIPLETSTWYVRNVGMVKSDSQDLTGMTSLELISIE